MSKHNGNGRKLEPTGLHRAGVLPLRNLSSQLKSPARAAAPVVDPWFFWVGVIALFVVAVSLIYFGAHVALLLSKG